MEINVIYTGDNVPRVLGVADQQNIVMSVVDAHGRIVHGTIEIKNVCDFRWRATMFNGDCIILVERVWAWKDRKIKQYPLEPRWSRKASTTWRNRVKDSCSGPKDIPVPEPKHELSYEEIVEYLKSIR